MGNGLRGLLAAGMVALSGASTQGNNLSQEAIEQRATTAATERYQNAHQWYLSVQQRMREIQDGRPVTRVPGEIPRPAKVDMHLTELRAIFDAFERRDAAMYSILARLGAVPPRTLVITQRDAGARERMRSELDTLATQQEHDGSYLWDMLGDHYESPELKQVLDAYLSRKGIE